MRMGLVLNDESEKASDLPPVLIGCESSLRRMLIMHRSAMARNPPAIFLPFPPVLLLGDSIMAELSPSVSVTKFSPSI